jgi:hypothetical protein
MTKRVENHTSSQMCFVSRMQYITPVSIANGPVSALFGAFEFDMNLGQTLAMDIDVTDFSDIQRLALFDP